MATFDYAEALATANELIEFFGQPATITNPGAETGEPQNPTPGTPVTASATIVELDPEMREVNGTTVLATDKKLIIKVGSFEITPEVTTVSYGSPAKTLRITKNSPLNPGGTLLLHEAFAR